MRRTDHLGRVHASPDYPGEAAREVYVVFTPLACSWGRLELSAQRCCALLAGTERIFVVLLTFENTDSNVDLCRVRCLGFCDDNVDVGSERFVK